MKLHIKNVNSVKITKVKNWVIFFECDGQKYMIHEDSCGYETSHGLYKRKVFSSGRYELERICSIYASRYPIEFIGKFNGRHPVYSQINKHDFVTRLVYRGLATTDSLIVKHKLEQNNWYKEKANSLEARARQYREKMII